MQPWGTTPLPPTRSFLPPAHPQQPIASHSTNPQRASSLLAMHQTLFRVIQHRCMGRALLLCCLVGSWGGWRRGSCVLAIVWSVGEGRKGWVSYMREEGGREREGSGGRGRGKRERKRKKERKEYKEGSDGGRKEGRRPWQMMWL